MDNNIRIQLRPIQADNGDTLFQRTRRVGVFQNNTTPPPERRSTISSMMPAIYENTRIRNLSGGSNGSTASVSSTGSSINLDNQYSDNQLYSSDMSTPFPNNLSTVPQNRSGSSMSHRKLDRSLSDSDSNGSTSQRSVNSSRYKTELCRPFEESGSCKYGDKCQFAHGMHELRNLSRHPKYKTELCRTFHTIGFCPYGPRCHFVHADEGKPETSPKVSRQTRSGSSSSTQSSSGSSSPSLSPSASDNDYNIFNYQEGTTRVSLATENRQLNSLTVNINNFCSSNNNDIQTLEGHFNSTLNLNRNPINDNASNAFGGNFSSGCSNKSSTTTLGKDDIFSKVGMFNSAEVDNTAKQSSVSYNMQSVRLDNFPSSFVDASSSYWQSCSEHMLLPQALRPVDPYHHSPTGSMGSDGSGSDCSGSTESLAGSGCRDGVEKVSPFSQWIQRF